MERREISYWRFQNERYHLSGQICERCESKSLFKRQVCGICGQKFNLKPEITNRQERQESEIQLNEVLGDELVLS